MRKSLFLFAFAFLFTANIVFAQVNSSNFNIRFLAGSDSEPPTTPILLSATPIASTQIDINWSASLDNFALSGYVVIRNGVVVSTTTAQSFSDTGLNSGTSYNYVIRAFDSSFNYSSSSNVLSATTTTTSSVPSSSEISKASQGTIARVVIENLIINTGLSTSSFQFGTLMPSRIELRWGKTAAYELGYVANEAYSRTHNVLISELEPGTKYNYEIIGYTPHGQQTILKSGWFKTLEKNQIVEPPNVNHFEAIEKGSDVELSWSIAEDDKFSHVRIIRSHIGFPEHPQNGAVVYQGKAVDVVDEGILDLYSPVYYTAFVYDIFGNVSSGAIALAYLGVNENDGSKDYIEVVQHEKQQEVIKKIDLSIPVFVTEATSSLDTNRLGPDMKMPHASEIFIRQNGYEFTMFNNFIELSNQKDFLISIPKKSVSGNLKSIIVTVIDPTDTRKNYSYLLRINKNQTAYEATIHAFGISGNSQIKVAIYDYEAFVVGTYQAPLQFIGEDISTKKVLFPDLIFRHPKTFLIFLLFIPLSILYFWFLRKRTEDNL